MLSSICILGKQICEDLPAKWITYPIKVSEAITCYKNDLDYLYLHSGTIEVLG